MRELHDGELLEVGDIVETINAFFTRRETITRVTKKYAIHEEKYRARYTRKYDSNFGFIPYDREQAMFKFTAFTDRE
jgi:uncharacterized protein YjiK